MKQNAAHTTLYDCDVLLSVDATNELEIYINGYFLCSMDLSDLSESILDLIKEQSNNLIDKKFKRSTK